MLNTMNSRYRECVIPREAPIRKGASSSFCSNKSLKPPFEPFQKEVIAIDEA